jgi:hypothetical protein
MAYRTTVGQRLAESLLSDEVVAVFPLTWISGSGWNSAPLMARHGTVPVSDEAVARDERWVEPIRGYTLTRHSMLVVLRADQALMPYPRCITIRWQSGGGLAASRSSGTR